MALPAISAALTVGGLAFQGAVTVKNIIQSHKTKKKLKAFQKQMATQTAATTASIQRLSQGISMPGSPGSYAGGNGLSGLSRQGGNFPGFI